MSETYSLANDKLPVKQGGNPQAPVASQTPPQLAPYVIDGGTKIGHTHLKVSNLDRAVVFWRDIIGLEMQQKVGDQAAFLSAGNYHHHIGLNTWESKDGTKPPFGSTGLYHVAFLYPTRRALGLALKRLIETQWPLDGAADHGVSEALYLTDPDGNGVELYCDRAEKDWPRDSNGQLSMFTRRLDLESLLAAAE